MLAAPSPMPWWQGCVAKILYDRSVPWSVTSLHTNPKDVSYEVILREHVALGRSLKLAFADHVHDFVAA